MRLLLDEHFSSIVANGLRSAGHDVLAAVEDLRGWRDDDLIARAVIDERVLITRDRDFTNLVFRRRVSAPRAMIYIRYASIDSLALADLLIALIREHGDEMLGCIAVLAPTGVRLKPMSDEQIADL